MEGFETEQQKQQQSYFVRLGSLSTKLRHRALQHSLGKLQSARRSSQDVLAQLQRTLDLVGPIPVYIFPPICHPGVAADLHTHQALPFSPRWSTSSRAWTRSCREGRRSCSRCGWSGARSNRVVAKTWFHQR